MVNIIASRWVEVAEIWLLVGYAKKVKRAWKCEPTGWRGRLMRCWKENFEASMDTKLPDPWRQGKMCVYIYHENTFYGSKGATTLLHEK